MLLTPTGTVRSAVFEKHALSQELSHGVDLRRFLMWFLMFAKTHVNQGPSAQMLGSFALGIPISLALQNVGLWYLKSLSPGPMLYAISKGCV